MGCFFDCLDDLAKLTELQFRCLGRVFAIQFLDAVCAIRIQQGGINRLRQPGSLGQGLIGFIAYVFQQCLKTDARHGCVHLEDVDSDKL